MHSFGVMFTNITHLYGVTLKHTQHHKQQKDVLKSGDSVKMFLIGRGKNKLEGHSQGPTGAKMQQLHTKEQHYTSPTKCRIV